VARMGEGRGVHRVLVERSEGNRLLGRARRRRKDIIKADVKGVGCEDVDGIILGHCRVQWWVL